MTLREKVIDTLISEYIAEHGIPSTGKNRLQFLARRICNTLVSNDTIQFGSSNYYSLYRQLVNELAEEENTCFL